MRCDSGRLAEQDDRLCSSRHRPSLVQLAQDVRLWSSRSWDSCETGIRRDFLDQLVEDTFRVLVNDLACAGSLVPTAIVIETQLADVG